VTTTDIRKAAVLLMSLPRAQASAILARLDPRQVEAVTTEIAASASITREEQQSVIREFAQIDSPEIVADQDGLEVAAALIEQAFGPGRNTLEKLRHQVEALPFRFLHQVEGRTLRAFLVDEHPQTIAFVLSHLPYEQAAEVVAGLPVEQQLPIVRRIAAMGLTDREIVEEVAEELKRRMSRVPRQRFATSEGAATVAGILNSSDPPGEHDLLASLAADDPDLADEIADLMFSFEDIAKLPDDDVRRIANHVDPAQWPLALQGAGEELMHKIVRNMSKRAAIALKRQINSLGPARPSAIERARRQIAGAIRRLQRADRITASPTEAEPLTQVAGPHFAHCLPRTSRHASSPSTFAR
jgi:flagellar motor switch protein FliG